MTIRARRAFTILDVVLLSTPPAQAQIAIPAPQVFPTIDENSVDLTTGQVTVSHEQTNVGDPEESGLSRIFSGAWLRDNLVGTIQPHGH